MLIRPWGNLCQRWARCDARQCLLVTGTAVVGAVLRALMRRKLRGKVDASTDSPACESVGARLTTRDDEILIKRWEIESKKQKPSFFFFFCVLID
jgi:hypothetical protein